MSGNTAPLANMFKPMPRAEVVKAVERKNPCRIPLAFAHWWGEGLWEEYGERLNELNRYPEDVRFIGIPKFDVNAMKLSWKIEGGKAHDANLVIDDWAKLDEFIAKLPDPSKDPAFEQMAKDAARVHEEDLYLIVGWWGLFFETLWGLRGMENLLMDYHDHPDEIHLLSSALCDLYCRSIGKAAEVMKPDGYWTSDDLGHQTQSMMSPATFDALLKPHYCRVGEFLRKKKIHWWLHSCGNNTPLMQSLVDAGVRMFHPVQKHTMDERKIAREFGDKLGFWAGFDVQHALREGTPDQVRAEVRFLMDTFDGPGGGMSIAAGNGIVAGTPFENIDAFLDEAVRYGRQHRLDYDVSASGKGTAHRGT